MNFLLLYLLSPSSKCIYELSWCGFSTLCCSATLTTTSSWHLKGVSYLLLSLFTLSHACTYTHIDTHAHNKAKKLAVVSNKWKRHLSSESAFALPQHFQGNALKTKRSLFSISPQIPSLILPPSSFIPLAPCALPLRHHQQTCTHKHRSAFNYREHQGRMGKVLDREMHFKHWLNTDTKYKKLSP